MDAALEKLIAELPDTEGARRFFEQFAERHSSQAQKLQRSPALLSDILTLASFSPLLAATMIQHPACVTWLDKQRRTTGVRSKEDLLESLGRFALTNSTLEPHVMFARFRRRELLRIYLRDIRRLETIAEVTDEISNLADTILEYALDLARREMDNRYGQPLETDPKGRATPARFCVVALGKLGSRELNYSSDLDLIFLYSNDGNTSGTGSRGSVTNKEYFIKLAEYLVKLVGEASGEGAAFRIDLRLRPHGRLGAIALSCDDAVRYYKHEARAWERQVMIRSRGCAGDSNLFTRFFSRIEGIVFSKNETPATALANVRLSKEQIDREQVSAKGFDVKLGRGGIREIEFIAQALQLAFGGRDRWLRSSHTLISLDRLAQRRHITEDELAGLTAAYDFLRRTEHVLQMENGVQTHTVPADAEKFALVARRMEFVTDGSFDAELERHTSCVNGVFTRIFGADYTSTESDDIHLTDPQPTSDRLHEHLMSSIAKSDVRFDRSSGSAAVLERIASISPHFTSFLAANPDLAASLSPPAENSDLGTLSPDDTLKESDFGRRLATLRRSWSEELMKIVVADVFETLGVRGVKTALTSLAEVSLDISLQIVSDELARKYGSTTEHPLSVLALGKLGGGGVDYDSDLDLVLVYDEDSPLPQGVTAEEFYSRGVELLITTMSSMTREGSLYRIDLRLRPYGSKGLPAISAQKFVEYMASTAGVWELLAFVKLRAVGGGLDLAQRTESTIRDIIHRRALEIPRSDLAAETRRIRLALEVQRSRGKRTGEIDIKYGAGGMLDVYFAMRYLQLAHNVPDPPNYRSTSSMLQLLLDRGHLSKEAYGELSHGYEFLADLDHNLRLIVGRTTRLPAGQNRAMDTISQRMNLPSSAKFVEELNLRRLGVRNGFDQICANAA
ncbi:MAG: hypothetical protein JO053_03485 [Acidobacteria bacterium]|nr:hypothetical protein [Acidobacteriota bacterium]